MTSSNEEKPVTPANWVPVRQALEFAYAERGLPVPEGDLPVVDWNNACHVVAHTLKYHSMCATKCLHCGAPLPWAFAYRCFDCKAPLCEKCAPDHFGPGHQERAEAAHR